MTSLPNMQPAEPPTHLPGVLDVVQVWKTIQGEGPLAGTPAVFVRLAGCNLHCTGCDTDYTTNRKPLTVEQLIGLIVESGGETNLVVVTGGEPFRQSLGLFAATLLEHPKNYRLQVETNGTVYRHDFPFPHARVTIVCSPKTPNIDPKFDPYVDAYKYILRADYTDANDGLPLDVMGNDVRPYRPSSLRLRIERGEILLQPFDSGDAKENVRNRKAVIESCMKYGYRVSLQLHKMLGVE